VNNKEYIESGVLELYVYDQLTAAERAEVERMCSQHPEIRSELDAIQEAVNGYVASTPRQPDPALKGKIMAELGLSDKPETKVIPINRGGANTYRWMAAASVALFIISLGGNFYLYNKYQGISSELADLQGKNTVLAENNKHLTRQITDVSDDLTALATESNVRIPLGGLALSPTARALIFWDKERKATYINTKDLPPLAMGKQYQLWAIVDGKPVDLGVLPTEKSQTAFVKVKDVAEPQAFAITIEPKGGSVNPTMDQMIVMGKL